jgi:hypothetical protein
MEIQHVNVKVILSNSEQFDLGPLIPVFHNWIQNQSSGELLLDIADYRHVPAGPGVIIIGAQGDYSVDQTDQRLGVRYNRKAPLNGSNQDRLTQAAHAAINACRRLQDDPLLGGKLRFNGQELEIFVNDRLVAPNQDSTRQALQPEMEAFSRKLFGNSGCALSYNTDPRRLFTAYLKASRSFVVTELLANLGM